MGVIEVGVLMSINNIPVQTWLVVQAHTYCIEATINLFLVINIDPVACYRYHGHHVAWLQKYPK